jgi:hypothetical protein
MADRQPIPGSTLTRSVEKVREFKQRGRESGARSLQRPRPQTGRKVSRRHKVSPASDRATTQGAGAAVPRLRP